MSRMDRWLGVDDQLVKYATFPKRRSSTVFAYLELPQEGDFEIPEAKDAAKGYANAAALFYLWRPAPMIIFATQRYREWIDMFTYSISGPSQHIKIHRYRFDFYDAQIDKKVRGAISAVMDGPDQALS
ncbi:hypothetical protein GGTG_08588 [Gaeumannomyces tritici R3-111a-1]|uniref:Uncharacterized protein n=1 Tax=Gaeumannomyces tritici (strain R3-111a-1) TaxID=644352 RepID=J3P502_GAET3|nr:hypothetical protein GGTG_08588 [Gaeumannomyces tritici R3-111a-1]EJT74750.1 hypothetical protein GGTG_08588 [Gaeumannomyces tritici R3-111a-1]